MNADNKPKVALILGDPNGIGPELTAKLVAEKETSGKAHLIIIADQQVLDEGMKVAGVNFNYRIADTVDADIFADDAPVLLGDQNGGLLYRIVEFLKHVYRSRI